jgi:molybdopterin/thiamine biosynthesis adenylyltransferase/rhodanese-related sulfurtransferase
MYNGQQIKSNGNISFDQRELARYNRHLIIPEFGMEGQQKLKSAKVLVVGTGGLGSPLLQYLAAAGVGTIGILDFDTVEESNLHRQVLFGISDVGKPKVEAAKHKLIEINPHIDIHVHNFRLTSDNAFDIIKDYDVVADGTDNFPTRYLVNDACVFLDKPNIYASIFQFEGQVSVFNYVDSNGERGPNYRDLFPTPPPPGLVPSCAEVGVLGVLPGIIGSIQANEVIKVITDVGDPLAGRLFLFDALSFITRTVKVNKRSDNPLTGDNPTQTELIDYQEFCGIPGYIEEYNDINEITVQEFKDKLDSDEDIQIIDVREPYEYEISNLGGELIPLNTILERHDKISRDKPVVVHCKAGVRSARAIRQLNEIYGFNNLYNLKGGIIEYAKQVDETVQQY